MRKLTLIFFKEIIFLSFQLPLLASTSGDILEVFLVKHSLVCNQLGRFSFSSKTFRPEEKNRRTLSPTSGQGPGFGQAINEVVSFNFFCIYIEEKIYFFSTKNIGPSNLWSSNFSKRKICSQKIVPSH